MITCFPTATRLRNTSIAGSVCSKPGIGSCFAVAPVAMITSSGASVWMRSAIAIV